MICKPPPLPQYVCMSIRTSPSKKVSFCYRCYYQHWSRYSMSPVCGIVFLLQRVLCSLKEIVLYLFFVKKINFAAHSENVKIPSFLKSTLNSPISTPTHIFCEQLFNIFWIVFLSRINEVESCIYSKYIFAATMRIWYRFSVVLC